MYYGLFLLLSSFICPLSMMFMFSVLLVLYSLNIYMFQSYSFLTMSNELMMSDQFSALLSLMTWILTFGCFLAILLSFNENYILFFLMIFISACSIMVFSSYCVFEFYINFEITLFPIFMMILGWGYQPERFNASMALLIYTITGSLPLFSYIAIFNFSQGVYFWQILDSYLSSSMNICFYLVIIAFLVKLPMFLVHMWLPKAHVEAPVFGSMFLAGTLLKLGGIGLIRFLMFMNTMASHKFLAISLISLIYVSVICLFAGDMKIIIAYSSVAHMALSLLMFFLMSELSVWSGAMILLTHGFSSSMMFLMAYILYLRTMTRSIVLNQNSLLWSSIFSMFWFLSCVGMMGGPPASTLISEVLGILSMMGWWNLSVLFLIFGAFLGGGYSIMLFSRTYHNFSNSQGSVKSPLSTIELMVSAFHLFWLMVYFFMFHWIMINQ